MTSWLIAKSPAIATTLASVGLVLAQAADGVQIGTDSVVTIGLLVVIVGAAVYLTRENTTLKNAAAHSIERANQQDKRIGRIEEKTDKLWIERAVRKGEVPHDDA